MDMDFGRIVKNLPLMYIAATAGVLIAALVLSKLSKRLIRKFMGRKRAEDSFWGGFWLTESRFVTRAISLFIWIAFIVAALSIWSDYTGKLASRIEHIYPPLLKSVFIIILAAVVLKIIHQLTRFLVEQLTPLAERGTTRGTQRVTTLNHTFRYGATIVIVIVTALMLLGTFGIDLKAILASVGVASLAIGFGAQSLVKDVVSGIFILMEDQFAVGDVAVINSEGGLVERMTLRITQLRNTEGTLVTIPNGEITMVKNMTSEWSRVDYKIGVAYECDLDRAVDVLMEEAKKLKEDMPDKIIADPERLGVDEFGDSSITIRVWLKVEPLTQWVVRRELNRRVHKRFDKEGIDIPFPQRTVWIKEPKEAIFAEMAKRKG